MRKDILKIVKDHHISDQSIVLAYFTDQVLVGQYQNEDIIFAKDHVIDDQLLTKMHIFNPKQELRIIVKDGELLNTVISIPVIEDETIIENMFIPFDHHSIKDIDDHFVRVSQYGRRVDIPKTQIKSPLNEIKDFYLEVRNHFTSDQAGFYLDQYQLADIKERNDER